MSRCLGPVTIVVTAATLPILAECQERGAPWTERPQATSDTAIGQKRRVPSGCGENRPLVRRSAQPYFPIRFSHFSCHRTIFARNAAREDCINRASALLPSASPPVLGKTNRPGRLALLTGVYALGFIKMRASVPGGGPWPE